MSGHAFDTAAAGHGLCPFMPVFGAPAVMFSRGAGCELWDADGKRYLDFLGGLAVISLGHAHPRIAAALAEQAGKLWHVSNLFANRAASDAALALCALLEDVTGQAGQVFLCNSGAEANEAAIKLARRFGGRGRHHVLSAYGSFHGRTLATLAATGQPTKHEAFQPLPEGFGYVTFNDPDELAARLDGTVAAVLLEPVQGEGGVWPADPGYLRAVRELCTERGALLILDEIQTGLGRTGRWFGFEHAGIVPDVVTMAKALGNGFPVGATWARREVSAVFRPGDHGSTYSGTALAGAVVTAVLDELAAIDAPRRAAHIGARLTAGLGALDAVRAVRGRGALLAAELREGIDAKAVGAELLRRGVVVNAVTASALRFAPPLTVADEQIDEVLGVLAAVLAEAVAGTGGGDGR